MQRLEKSDSGPPLVPLDFFHRPAIVAGGATGVLGFSVRELDHYLQNCHPRACPEDPSGSGGHGRIRWQGRIAFVAEWVTCNQARHSRKVGSSGQARG
jgi:hypothetical protein